MQPNTQPPRFFIVSPHLDDAVFSCAMLLAGHPASVVCTVLAGTPEIPQRRPWDIDAGFADSSAALGARWREDEEALAWLAAHAVRLPFLDGQNGAPPSVSSVATALACEVHRRPELQLLIPMGLWHSDHVLVSDACCEMLRLLQTSTCLVYEEALYRTIPEAVAQRRSALAERGFCLSPVVARDLEPRCSRAAAATKRRSVRAYRSQLRALDDPYPIDIDRPERYWQLCRQPPDAVECKLHGRRGNSGRVASKGSWWTYGFRDTR